jgi:hypothetical protein
LIEGAGRLNKVTVKGDEAQIETIQDGFAEPVSVTQVGDTGWVAEGKSSHIIGDNKQKDPFRTCRFGRSHGNAGPLARV